jgi:hypothetical protein
VDKDLKLPGIIPGITHTIHFFSFYSRCILCHLCKRLTAVNHGLEMEAGTERRAGIIILCYSSGPVFTK